MGVLDLPERPQFNSTIGRWNEFMFQPSYRLEIKMRHENLAWAYEKLLRMTPSELEIYADRSTGYPALIWAAANSILTAGEKGDFFTLDKITERVLGKAPPTLHLTEAAKVSRASNFTEFCVRAGYPPPFAKQIELMEFGMYHPGSRLVLGSRGYGKTEYIVILGVAWALFNNPKLRFLIITKSDTRNKGIIREVVNALELNGVVIRDKVGMDVNVQGQKGKDPSVSAITIGSRSFRGRHPDVAIMDDPVTPEDAHSLATRKQVEIVYSELVKLTSNVVTIGQPAHKSDLYALLRDKVKLMEVPHGTIPELDHDLVAMKAAGASLASIEMSYHLRVPIDSANPLHGIQSCPDFPKGSCVAFIDPSFKGGDYTAMSVFRQYLGGIAVYGRVWQRAWYDLAEEICEVVADKGVGRLAFETNSLGDEPIRVIRSHFADEGIACGVVPWNTTSNKHARIIAMGPFANTIYVSEDSDVEYRNQVKDYEYGIKNDDAPDSLASGLEWIGYVRGPGK